MGKIIKIKIKPYSVEWFENRANYINASEAGGVLGLSPYANQIPPRIFANKVGYMTENRDGNKFTYWGSKTEDLIANAWEYHEYGQEDSYVKNERAGKKVRKCGKYRYSMVNSDYPWLSVTIDRAIKKGQKNLITGEVLKKDCPLEIKTIDFYEMIKWESNIPLTYLVQVYCQMIVMGVDYGEIAMLDSKKNLHVFPIQRSEELSDIIINGTKDFWYNRVIPAKELFARLKENPSLQEEIDKLEPPPGDTSAYEDFYKEKYKYSYVDQTIKGDIADYENAVNYKKTTTEIQKLDLVAQELKNKLIAKLKDKSKILLDEKAYVSYSKSVKGYRTFKVYIP